MNNLVVSLSYMNGKQRMTEKSDREEGNADWNRSGGWRAVRLMLLPKSVLPR